MVLPILSNETAANINRSEHISMILLFELFAWRARSYRYGRGAPVGGQPSGSRLLLLQLGCPGGRQFGCSTGQQLGCSGGRQMCCPRRQTFGFRPECSGYVVGAEFLHADNPTTESRHANACNLVLRAQNIAAMIIGIILGFAHHGILAPINQVLI